MGYWKILQYTKPIDFVLELQERHPCSFRDFVVAEIEVVDIKIKWIGKGLNEKGINQNDGKILVEIDEQYYRPLEVHYLCGDSTKSKKNLAGKM